MPIDLKISKGVRSIYETYPADGTILYSAFISGKIVGVGCKNKDDAISLLVMPELKAVADAADDYLDSYKLEIEEIRKKQESLNITIKALKAKIKELKK